MDTLASEFRNILEENLEKISCESWANNGMSVVTTNSVIQMLNLLKKKKTRLFNRKS